MHNSSQIVDEQVNSWIRNFFLDSNGALGISVNRNFTLTQSSGIQLLVKSIRLTGVDTMTGLDPFVLLPESNFTFQSVGALTRLGIAIDATGIIQMKNTITNSTHVWTESFTVRSEIHQPSASFISTLILNKDKLGKIQLGSLTDILTMATSLFQSSNFAKIVSLNLDIHSWDKPSFTGLATQAEEDSVETIISLLYGMYNVPIVQAVSGYLKDVLNRYADQILLKGPRTMINQTYTKNGYINFGDLLSSRTDAIAVGGTGNSPYGTLFYRVKSLINKQVLATDPITDLSTINKLIISPITKQQSNVTGLFSYPGTLFEKDIRLKLADLSGNLHVTFFDAAVGNINSLNTTSRLLQPISEHQVENIICFNHLNATISVRLSYVSSKGEYLIYSSTF